MDSVTQAVLGATLNTALLGKQLGRRALLYGAALATLPDLDVIVRYADPVSAMTYHRGFSHSLMMLTLFASVLTAIIQRWRPIPGASWQRLWLAIWLTLITHPLLDAFTSYGTQLWWPFTPTPTAWSSIFIIDPAYTLPMLVAVLIAFWRGPDLVARRWLVGTLVCSTLYLGWGLAAQQIAQHRAVQALERIGVEATANFTTPASFTSLLWRVVSRGENPDVYYETVVGLLDDTPPHPVALPSGAGWRDVLADSPWHDRLDWFSGGWLRYDVIDDRLVVSDLRMGIVGNHFFRFLMAEGDPSSPSGWRIVQPTDWQVGMAGTRAELARLFWERTWSSGVALPMEEWDALMTTLGRRTP